MGVLSAASVAGVVGALNGGGLRHDVRRGNDRPVVVSAEIVLLLMQGRWASDWYGDTFGGIRSPILAWPRAGLENREETMTEQSIWKREVRCGSTTAGVVILLLGLAINGCADGERKCDSKSVEREPTCATEDEQTPGEQSAVIEKMDCSVVPDCHAAANDGDLGRGCCTRHTANGTWQLILSNPDHPRHCCIGN